MTNLIPSALNLIAHSVAQTAGSPPLPGETAAVAAPGAPGSAATGGAASEVGGHQRQDHPHRNPSPEGRRRVPVLQMCHLVRHHHRQGILAFDLGQQPAKEDRMATERGERVDHA